MTKEEKAIREFCGQHADWWPSTTQVQEMLALAHPEQYPQIAISPEIVGYVAPQRKPLTDEEIEEIAEGYLVDYELDDGTTNAFDKRYEAFAKLVAEKEREKVTKKTRGQANG